MHRIQRRRRQHHAVWAGVLWIAMWVTGTARADPRQEMKAAYQSAKQQFDDLELDTAESTLNIAIARAQGSGWVNDPGLAPLFVLRGGIIFLSTGDRSRATAVFREAVRADYHIGLPIELRTQKLRELLDDARSSVPPPHSEPIVHSAPAAVVDRDLEFEALSSIPLTSNTRFVLHWRPAGVDAPFASLELEQFGNLGTGTIVATTHDNTALEYYLVVYDDESDVLARHGEPEHPLTVDFAQDTDPSVTNDRPSRIQTRLQSRPPSSSTTLPRIMINLGLGTGLGIAHGTVDFTYKQFQTDPLLYGEREQACAFERWYIGPYDDSLAANREQFSEHLNDSGLNPMILDGLDRAALEQAYDPEVCAERHPISVGIASAPLHLAPEVAVRFYDRIIGGRQLSLQAGVFGRLQIVTQSRLFIEPSDLNLNESYTQQLRSVAPPTVRRRVPLTWALGAKLKVVLSNRGRRFAGVMGVFGGYGRSRLRIDLKQSNDRNGNSVPDGQETGFSANTQEGDSGQPIAPCVPVWPYNRGCEDSVAGRNERTIASTLRANTDKRDSRVDTMTLGPAFAGVLFGFNYRIFEHLSVFAEANVGGWFPNKGSLLVDLNIGPLITF